MSDVCKPHLLLPVHRLKIKWLRHNGHKISKWERCFLKDVKNKKKLSIKQVGKINEIYNFVRFSDVIRYIGSEHYNGEYFGLSDYAYIHDFDR